MKKYGSAFLIALCFSFAAAFTALAAADQSIIDAFCHTWVCDGGSGSAVDIWEENGELQLIGLRTDAEGEDLFFTFRNCTYDASSGALRCEGGALLRDVPGETEEETAEVTVSSGFEAALTVDQERHLHWTGSGNAVPDRIYEIWEMQDDGLFVGEWYSGDTWISIEKYDNDYTVLVALGSDGPEETFWEYVCYLDNETGSLNGVGTKTRETYTDDQLTRSVTEYTDGGVTFRIEDGVLTWIDGRENAGRNMRFLRTIHEDQNVYLTE